MQFAANTLRAIQRVRRESSPVQDGTRCQKHASVILECGSMVLRAFELEFSGDVSNEDSNSRRFAPLELAEEIETRAEPLVLRSGQVLFRQGDPLDWIFLLKKGEIEFTLRLDGQIIYATRGAAVSIIGIAAVGGQKDYSTTAKASQDSELYRLSAENFSAMVETSRLLSFQTLHVLAAEAHSIVDALANAFKGSARPHPVRKASDKPLIA